MSSDMGTALLACERRPPAACTCHTSVVDCVGALQLGCTFRAQVLSDGCGRIRFQYSANSDRSELYLYKCESEGSNGAAVRSRHHHADGQPHHLNARRPMILPQERTSLVGVTVHHPRHQIRRGYAQVIGQMDKRTLWRRQGPQSAFLLELIIIPPTPIPSLITCPLRVERHGNRNVPAMPPLALLSRSGLVPPGCHR